MRLLSRFAIVLVCACGTKSPSPPSPPSPPSDPWASPPRTAAPAAPASGSSDSGDAARRIRDQILGVNAHVIVLKSVSDFAEYRDVLSLVERNADVVAAEPFHFIEASIASASRPPLEVAMKGVDPQRVAGVLDLGAHLKVGTIRDLETGEPPAIILGDVLAERLAVRAGDRVTVTLPPNGTPPAGDPVPGYPFRVTGIFHVGFDEYDERLAYASIAAIQNVVNRGDRVMGIEAKVKDIDRSDKVAKAIEQALGGPPYRVMDWYELNRELFRKLYGERRP